MLVLVFCCFSISGFPILKVLQKFGKNQIKNQRTGTFRKHLVGARGPPPGAQAPWWRAPWAGRDRGGAWTAGAPLAALLRLYILRDEETLKYEALFPISSLF